MITTHLRSRVRHAWHPGWEGNINAETTLTEGAAVWSVYLEKAQSNLRVAEMACDAGEYDPAVSRAYYAVLQVEIAALLKLTDFHPQYWGHDRVPGEFNRRLIHRQKVFPTSLRFFHSDLLGRRHIADYEREQHGRGVAERCVRKAQDMVSVVARRLAGEQP
jgi:uncharacterized protein (UPF0332 family)